MNMFVKFCILSFATAHSAAQFAGVFPDRPAPSPVLAPGPSAATDGEFEPIFVDPVASQSDFPSDSPSDAPSDVPSLALSDAPSDTPSSMPVGKEFSAQAGAVPEILPAASKSDFPSDSPSDAPSDVPSLALSDAPSDTPSSMPVGEEFSAQAGAVSSFDDFLSALLSSSSSDIPSDTPSDIPSATPSDYPSMIPSDVPSSTPSADPLGTVNNYTICGPWSGALEQAEVSQSYYVYTLQLAAPQMDVLDTVQSLEKLIETELVEKLCNLFPFALAVAATPDDTATASCGDSCYILYGAVAIKSSTENADELLEVKCQAQRTIREMFIYRSFDTLKEIEDATLLYFDQNEELQCSTLDDRENEGFVPSEQVTDGGASILSEESSDDGFFTSAALVGLSFLGGTLIAAVVVGMHYKRTQRNARRNVNITEEDLSMIIADV